MRQGILSKVEVHRVFWGYCFRSGHLTAARLLLILYSMPSCAVLWRCSKEGQSSSCSISLMLAVLWCQFRTNLAACQCLFVLQDSTQCMSTPGLVHKTKRPVGLCLDVTFPDPQVTPEEAQCSVCLCHNSIIMLVNLALCCSVTPRYLVEETFSSTWF